VFTRTRICPNPVTRVSLTLSSECHYCRQRRYVRPGRSVASVASDLDVSAQTIYTWRRQDAIDRGEVPGLSSTEPAELMAACRCVTELDAAHDGKRHNNEDPTVSAVDESGPWPNSDGLRTYTPDGLWPYEVRAQAGATVESSPKSLTRHGGILPNLGSDLLRRFRSCRSFHHRASTAPVCCLFVGEISAGQRDDG
jgi:hypothetical protein